MARRKLRGRGSNIVVPGSHPVRDEHGQVVIASRTIIGEGVPAFVKQGQPVWRKPAANTHALHFKNAAAKNRARAKMAEAAEKDPANALTGDANLVLFAEPKDLIRVPEHRGFDCRVAGTMRRAVKKAQHEQAEAQAALVAASAAALTEDKTAVESPANG